MPYSNRNELSRLFGTFCHLWSKGLHAKVQMKTTESGGVLAQFEIELDKPHKPFPTGLPGFRRSQSHRAPRRHLTNQALPMHQANQEHRESADVGHVDAAQKRSNVLDYVLQLIRLL